MVYLNFLNTYNFLLASYLLENWWDYYIYNSLGVCCGMKNWGTQLHGKNSYLTNAWMKWAVGQKLPKWSCIKLMAEVPGRRHAKQKKNP